MTLAETRQYDALSRVITDTVSGPGSPSLTTATRYDHDGNVYQVVRPVGTSRSQVAIPAAAIASSNCCCARTRALTSAAMLR